MKSGVAVAVLLLGSMPALAQDWFVPDAKARGRGNTGVASTTGPNAVFWNPAALALDQGEEEAFSFSAGGFGLMGNFGLDVDISGDFLVQIDEVYDIMSGADYSSLQARLNSGTGSPADVQTALDLVAQLSDLTVTGGVVVQTAGSVEARYGPFGFFVRQLGHGALISDIDFGSAISLSSGTGGTSALDQILAQATPGAPVGPNATLLSAELLAAGIGLSPGDADTLASNAETGVGDAGLTPAVRASIVASATASSATFGTPSATLLFNESGVDVTGIEMTEAGVSFAYSLSSNLHVGVAVKEIRGETFEISFGADDLTSTDDLVEDIKDQYDKNRKKTNVANVDVGLVWTPIPTVTIGVVGRNLIEEEFDFSSGGKFVLEPQVRAGIAIDLGFVILSVDYDLTENTSSALPGHESRMAGVGLAMKAGKVLHLSVGAFQNTATSDDDTVYALGLGFRLGPLVIDIAANVADVDVDIEAASALNGSTADDFPSRVAASASIGFDLSF